MEASFHRDTQKSLWSDPPGETLHGFPRGIEGVHQRGFVRIAERHSANQHLVGTGASKKR